MSAEQRHLEVVATLGLLEGKEEAESLKAYLSPSDQAVLQAKTNRLLKIPTDNLSKELEQHLKALRAGEDFSGLAEIHPGWLLEILKNESPRVIGVVLRHLPSRHVRFLLEHLPTRVTMGLPKLIEAFYVPTELLNVLRRKVERHFVPMHISHQITAFEFQHLYCLKIEELEELFYDLGLSELASSLVYSPRKILKVILNRFTIGEAKEILDRLKTFQGEPKWFLQDARYSVLELGEEAIGPKRFLGELGLLSLAKALKDTEFLYQALRQKMAPEKAYLFKRYLDEAGAFSGQEKVAKRQAWVLGHVSRLSQKGKIDSFWASCFERKAA